MSLPTGLSATFWSRWDGTSSITESLDDGESWIGGWDGVGLYEGNNKVPAYQNMTVHITTHRLVLVPDRGVALQAPLSAVRQTEFYAGFMRSSAKITLSLGWSAGASLENASTSIPPSASAPPASRGETSAPESNAHTWTCGVCGFSNPLVRGTVVTPSSKCQLCGVQYAMSRTMSPPPSRPASAAAALPISPAPVPVSTSASAISTPSSTPTPDEVACGTCTFLNHASLSNCEMCGSPLARRQKSTKQEKETKEENGTVRLSFREGGEREAYKRLKGVLSDKAWERAVEPVRVERGGGGIDAIMRNISLEAKAKDEGMQDAFRDLEVLMVRAGEMVRIAQSLNARLTAAGASEEEATLVRSSLVRLGLPQPALTQDMVRDEAAYLDGLATELGNLLTGQKGREGLMLQPGNGVVALDQVWGLWMRARGVALLPPSTLVELLPLLPRHTAPTVRGLTLPSGLQVLYTPVYAPTTLLARLVARMSPEGNENDEGAEKSLSILDIAALEGLPIGLATELVDLVSTYKPPVGSVGIVRDDQASASDGGVRWYRDIISFWPLEDMGGVGQEVEVV